MAIKYSMLQKNVLGEPLQLCCQDPVTGYLRDGFCHTGQGDLGSHVICAIMSQEFLDFSKSQGNDLSTPNPEWGFPGLKPGDRWCLCAMRWVEAKKSGKAPRVILAACHEKALIFTSLQILQHYARLN